MKIKELNSRLQSAYVMNDVDYAMQSIETYFREQESGEEDADLWWLLQQIENLSKFKDDLDKLQTIMGVTGCKSLGELEKLALDGLKYKEQQEEQIETLLSIKDELSKAYARLVRSLP